MVKIKTCFNSLLYYLSSLWLFGALFKAGKKTFSSAFYEFTYALVWSIFPFVLGTLTLYVISVDPDKQLMQFAVQTYSNGELLIFTISMLTPILYLVLHDPDQGDSFPHKLPISTLVALIAVTCAALFALLKAEAIKDTQFVLNLSIALTLIALSIRYLSLVYHRLRMPETKERDLRSNQVNFVNKFSHHVGSPTQQAQPAEDFTSAFARHIEDK